MSCNRGPFPACLDWTEICDGEPHCFDGADEQHCRELDLDEPHDYQHERPETTACHEDKETFLCDELVCRRSPLTISCSNTRSKKLFKALFTRSPPNIFRKPAQSIVPWHPLLSERLHSPLGSERAFGRILS
ncbi:hypothetical protein I4U23_031516 [Adineta vaga]|nr:hypothetical protein I4U23_031516 [Adineta vaga]